MMSSPGRLEIVRRSPIGDRGRGAQPGRDGGQHGRAGGGIRLHRADRHPRGQRGQGRAGDPRRAGAGRFRAGRDLQLLTQVAESGKLAELAGRDLRPGPGPAAARLDDAIEIAVALADEADARLADRGGPPGTPGAHHRVGHHRGRRAAAADPRGPGEPAPGREHAPHDRETTGRETPAARGGPRETAAGSGPDEATPMKRLCATVLIMEAIVIGLAIPVAIAWSTRPAAKRSPRGSCSPSPRSCWPRWPRGRSGVTLVGGSVLQVLVIAAGVDRAGHVRARRDLRRTVGDRHLARPPRRAASSAGSACGRPPRPSPHRRRLGGPPGPRGARACRLSADGISVPRASVTAG